MSISRKIIGFMAFVVWIACLPAGAQTTGKETAPAKPPSVTVSRPARVRLGGFVFGAGYGYHSGYYPYRYYSGPYFWPWYDSLYFPSYYGFNSPLWYHPGWFTGYSYRAGMGEVRIRTGLPDADVYLDDGFAGKAKDLKSMWLEPGAYNVKVEASGHDPFAVRIYVLSGKTLKLDARLIPHQEP